MKQLLLSLCFLFSAGGVLGKDLPGQIFYEDDTVDVIFEIPLKPVSKEPSLLEIQKSVWYRVNGEKKYQKALPAMTKEIRFSYMETTFRMISTPRLIALRKDIGPGLVHKRFTLLRIDGEVRLFESFYLSESATRMNANGSWSGGRSQISGDIFLERNGVYTWIKPIGFNKKVANYFRDCEELFEKITNKTLRYEDIESIVNTYNQSCAGNMKG
ncbi:MAG: hypothetical protein AB8F95_02055 [Bacteroidia bacterium]